MNQPLTPDILRQEAAVLAEKESGLPEPTLYGVTAGKAVGTYVELKVCQYLKTKYGFVGAAPRKASTFPISVWTSK